MARNVFTDPAGNVPPYSWQINHSEETEFGKERSIDHGANTANTGLVKQQSDDSPMVISVTGIVLHAAQHQAFIDWFALCKDQTIYFDDFSGDSYEIIITSYKPTRHRTVKNPRDFANAPLWFWRYELHMEVIAFRDSPWEAVAP